MHLSLPIAALIGIAAFNGLFVARSAWWQLSGRCAHCGATLTPTNTVSVAWRTLCSTCATAFTTTQRRTRNVIVAVVLGISLLLLWGGLAADRQGSPDAPIVLTMAGIFGAVVAAHFALEWRRRRHRPVP